MSVKLISYDLGKPETSQSYKELIAYIKSLGPWCKPLYSCFLVDSGMSAAAIRDGAKGHIDGNDRLFVLPCTLGTWASYGLPEDVVSWLNTH